MTDSQLYYYKQITNLSEEEIILKTSEIDLEYSDIIFFYLNKARFPNNQEVSVINSLHYFELRTFINIFK